MPRPRKETDTTAELQEMLDSIGWDAALKNVTRSVGNLRSKILGNSFNDPHQVQAAIGSLGWIKTILYDIYNEAGIEVPDKMKALFE
jgi:hypothetical protein